MKKFIKLFLASTISILFIVFFINWYVDPMWIFNFGQANLSVKEEFDERQQKTNLVYFKDFDYDGLIMGSSRMTIIDQTKIKKYKVFNYAANAMSPYEFNNYIKYASKKNKKNFQIIILGMDFDYINYSKNTYKNSFEDVVNKTEDIFYRVKTSLSVDVMKFTKTNIYFNLKPSAYKHHFKIYNNSNIAFTIGKEPSIIKHKIDTYTQANKDIIYSRETYLKSLKELKQDNPDSKFIIMTTPMNASWFHKIMLEKHTATSYKEWVEDMISVFGEVNHFNYINSVTRDYPNTYVDVSHYTSSIGELMIDIVLNQPINESVEKYKNDFGIVLKKENYNQYIDKFIFEAKNYEVLK